MRGTAGCYGRAMSKPKTPGRPAGKEKDAARENVGPNGNGPPETDASADENGPRDQLNELLNGAVEAAVELLEVDGEFDPFALALRHDGEVLHLTSDGGHVSTGEDDEGPDPDAVVESLRNTLRERRDELTAIAIVADVTLEDEEDEAMTAAIAVSLEHALEEPIACFVPYEIDDKSKVALADLIGEPGERHVFAEALPN